MSSRPRVICSVAVSLDGCIDDQSSKRLILSNEENFRAIDELRAQQDAILVGAGTLRADNPRLLISSEDLRTRRVERGLPPDLIKVTITRGGDLDPALKFFSTGTAEKLVYCPEKQASALRDRLGTLATVVSCPASDISPSIVLEDLSKRGVQGLLVEGGESIQTSFLQAGLVDELRVAVAPFFVGDSKAPRFVGSGNFPFGPERRMHLAAVEQLGDMAVLKYRLNSDTSPAE